MRSRIYPLVGLVALTTLLLGTVCSAELIRVQANVSVTTFEDPGTENRLDFWIVPIDSDNKRPPDFVRWVKVIMPDGTELDLTNNWEEWWDDYGAYIPESQLPGGVIQSGRYVIKVKDKTGKLIKVTDKLIASATLTPPSITDPTDGMTVGTLTPTITWTSVPGTAVYRLHLVFCGNWPVGGDGPYWYPHKVPHIDGNTNYFKVPEGVLKSGECYITRVEALDEQAYRDHRGRSDWVQFNTP